MLASRAVGITALCPEALPQVFVVTDGGSDLEHFELRSFQEVRSILMQASKHAS